jgi:hypothetical protein
MGQTSTKQEILLMTGTSFSSRQWCEKDGSGGENSLQKKRLRKPAGMAW